MLEKNFQRNFINEILNRFPGAIVLKNDPTYIQGFPDLIILYRNHWAVIECKKSRYEPYQPNQEFYLAVTNDMSYSATVYPENMEDILNELQQALRP